MKNQKNNNLDCLVYDLQDLSSNEQKCINGGSGVTTLLGRAVGAVVGGIVDIYTAISFINANSCD